MNINIYIQKVLYSYRYQVIMTSNQQLTMKQQITLDNLIKQIKKLYQQLKICQHQPIQATIIWALQPKCQQVLKILKESFVSSQYAMKKAWVLQVKQKIKQISSRLQKKQRTDPQIGYGGRNVGQKIKYTQQDLKAQFGLNAVQQFTLPSKQTKKIQQKQDKQFKINKIIGEIQHKPQKKTNQKIRLQHQQLDQSSIMQGSRKILRSIAMLEMKSVNLKYTKQELDQILKRLQANNQVMKAMQSMIIEQGNNIDVVQKNIEKAYQNVQKTNAQLSQAEQNQLKYISTVSVAYRSIAGRLWGVLSWPFRKFYRYFRPK